MNEHNHGERRDKQGRDRWQQGCRPEQQCQFDRQRNGDQRQAENLHLMVDRRCAYCGDTWSTRDALRTREPGVLDWWPLLFETAAALAAARDLAKLQPPKALAGGWQLSDQECRSFRRTRAEDPFTFGSVTVAKMWSRPGGHACYVQKRDDVWVVTQERKGHVVRASNVGSAAEALRTVEEFEETFDSAARSA